MKKFILIFASGVLFSLASNAQKIGHINNFQILEQMPAYKEAINKLKEYENEYVKQIEEVQKQLQEKYSALQNQASTLTQAKKEVMEKDAQRLYENYQKITQEAETALKTKEGDLLKPIVEDLKSAIKKVAEKGGYDYILENTGIHYGKESLNINNQVKAELGIK